MRVEIHLKEQSQPVVAEGVRNTYIKGDLFCVMYEADDHGNYTVDKFPIQDIFRVRET